MAGKSCVVLAIALCIALAKGQVTPAPPCTEETACALPACRCSGPEIPGGLNTTVTPQLVFLTFDDAVTIDNYPFYKEVLTGRNNPNGQPITATFFVSHEYTNYSMVHDLWRNGHDIGLHSITHSPDVSYWSNLDEATWAKEMVDQREQMTTFGRVPASEIKGIRAPLLQGGGDNMYKVLSAARFQWDCSRPTLNYRKPGLWPYTNDYATNQDCQIEPCPIGAYPGFWTFPMIDMIGDDGEGCAMVDTCKPVPETVDTTYNLILRNFMDHYTSNKAPFGIYVHHGWMNGTGNPEVTPLRRQGYEKFLDHLKTLPDVYIVGISRALDWIKTPTTVAELPDFAPFKVTVRPNQCPTSYSCLYPPELTPFPEERWLHSCVPCPNVYPWIGNHLGRNPMP